MKRFKVNVITFGVLIILIAVGIVMLRTKKNESIASSNGNAASEAIQLPAARAKMTITEPASPEGGAVKVVSNEQSSAEIEANVVAQQLANWPVLQSAELVNSLTNTVMREILRHGLEAVQTAKKELEEIEKDIQSRKISRTLFNGTLDVGDDTEWKSVQYDRGVTGPIRTYQRYIDAGINCTNVETGTKLVYDLHFDRNGRIKSSERPEVQDLLEFHPNGRLKSFVVEDYQKGKYTGEYYMASWDENGRFIREGRFGKVPPM